MICSTAATRRPDVASGARPVPARIGGPRHGMGQNPFMAAKSKKKQKKKSRSGGHAAEPSGNGRVRALPDSESLADLLRIHPADVDLSRHDPRATPGFAGAKAD